MDLISIIIPAYNAQNHIGSCMKSVIDQTNPNIEIVVVNDGSTDDTEEIVQGFASNDPRIKIISKPNAGLPQARKTGVEYSIGKYICFVDSDDWIEPDYCLNLYAAITSTNADIATCGISFDRNDGHTKKLIGPKEHVVMNRDEALVALHRRSGIFQYMHNKLIRRELFDGIEFLPNNLIGEDYDLTTKLLENTNAVVHIPIPLYHYIQSNSSMSHAGYDVYAPSYQNYLQIQARLNERYPELAQDVAVYHVGDRDLSTLFAMVRSNNINWNIAHEAQADVRKYLVYFLKRSHDPLFIKAAAVLLATSTKTFFRTYGIFAGLTRRMPEN